jgi:hypothetical protein
MAIDFIYYLFNNIYLMSDHQYNLRPRHSGDSAYRWSQSNIFKSQIFVPTFESGGFSNLKKFQEEIFSGKNEEKQNSKKSASPFKTQKPIKTNLSLSILNIIINNPGIHRRNIDCLLAQQVFQKKRSKKTTTEILKVLAELGLVTKKSTKFYPGQYSVKLDID